jgi:hypothetical protein
MNVKQFTLRSLGCKTLVLKKPIRVTITESGPSQFVAEAPQLQLILKATAQNPNAAIRRLAAGVVTQYGLLATTPLQERYPFHTQILRRLRRHLKEVAEERDSSPTCRQVD